MPLTTSDVNVLAPQAVTRFRLGRTSRPDRFGEEPLFVGTLAFWNSAGDFGVGAIEQVNRRRAMTRWGVVD